LHTVECDRSTGVLVTPLIPGPVLQPEEELFLGHLVTPVWSQRAASSVALPATLRPLVDDRTCLPESHTPRRCVLTPDMFHEPLNPFVDDLGLVLHDENGGVVDEHRLRLGSAFEPSSPGFRKVSLEVIAKGVGPNGGGEAGLNREQRTSEAV